MHVLAEKTVTVPFTRKLRLDGIANPLLNRICILFSSEVKLTWNTHVDDILKKARMALGICSRLTGARWGLQPKIAFWLYTAIERPMVLYALPTYHCSHEHPR